MTQTKLKIYQELFDEVIARDKVFGGLLRKIKGAYENYFEGAECERTHGGESQQEAPGIVRGMRTGAQTPVEDSGSLEGRVHDLHQLGQSEGAESNAGTERQKSGNEALAAEERTQDLEKENRALRGLIARLHSERNQARQALALCEAKQQQGPTTSKFDHEKEEDFLRPGAVPSFLTHGCGVVPSDAARQRPTSAGGNDAPGRVAGHPLLGCERQKGSKVPLANVERGADEGPADTARTQLSDLYLPQKPSPRVIRPGSVPSLDLTQAGALACVGHDQDDEEDEEEVEDDLEGEECLEAWSDWRGPPLGEEL